MIILGMTGFGTNSSPGTLLIDLLHDDKEYIAVDQELQSTIREHRDNCGGTFSRYNVIRVSKFSRGIKLGDVSL